MHFITVQFTKVDVLKRDQDFMFSQALTWQVCETTFVQKLFPTKFKVETLDNMRENPLIRYMVYYKFELVTLLSDLLQQLCILNLE